MTDQKKKMIYALVLVLAIGVFATLSIKPADKFDYTYTYYSLGNNLVIDNIIFNVAGVLMIYFLLIALIAQRRDLKYKILESTQSLTVRMVLNNDSALYKNLIVIPGIFYIAMLLGQGDIYLYGIFFVLIAPAVSFIYFTRSLFQYGKQVVDLGIPSYRAFLHITTFLAIYGFLSFLICVFLTGYVGIL